MSPYLIDVEPESISCTFTLGLGPVLRYRQKRLTRRPGARQNRMVPGTSIKWECHRKLNMGISKKDRKAIADGLAIRSSLLNERR